MSNCAVLIEVSSANDVLFEFQSIRTTVYFVRFKIYRSVEELKSGANPATEYSAYMDRGKLCTEASMYKSRGCRVFITTPQGIKVMCPSIRFE